MLSKDYPRVSLIERRKDRKVKIIIIIIELKHISLFRSCFLELFLKTVFENR